MRASAMGVRQRCKGFFCCRSESGSAALEFAFTGPFLVLLMVAAVEVGTAAYQSMQVQSAAEAGAIYASKYGANIAGISNAVASATGDADITATPTPSQFCGCPSAGGINTVQCSTPCTDGVAPGYYLRITAQIAHDPILALPGLSMPATMIGEAVVRLY
jgi:Flp pilus assembly protein TadG